MCISVVFFSIQFVQLFQFLVNMFMFESCGLERHYRTTFIFVILHDSGHQLFPCLLLGIKNVESTKLYRLLSPSFESIPAVGLLLNSYYTFFSESHFYVGLTAGLLFFLISSFASVFGLEHGEIKDNVAPPRSDFHVWNT